MNEVKKSDCSTLLSVMKQLNVTRNTLNAYMFRLGIQKVKFPLDTKVYIANSDIERIVAFVRENKG